MINNIATVYSWSGEPTKDPATKDSATIVPATKPTATKAPNTKKTTKAPKMWNAYIKQVK